MEKLYYELMQKDNSENEKYITAFAYYHDAQNFKKRYIPNGIIYKIVRLNSGEIKRIQLRR